MALAEQVGDLTARVQAELARTNDYYHHSKVAWRILKRLADAGHRFGVQNVDTGTAVDGPRLAALAQG